MADTFLGILGLCYRWLANWKLFEKRFLKVFKKFIDMLFFKTNAKLIHEENVFKKAFPSHFSLRSGHFL